MIEKYDAEEKRLLKLVREQASATRVNGVQWAYPWSPERQALLDIRIWKGRMRAILDNPRLNNARLDGKLELKL